MTGFLVGLILLIQTPAALQGQLGTIAGILRTNQGAPIPNTRVAIAPVDADAGSVLQGLTQTDSDGKYRLDDIPPGRYRIVTGPVGNPIYLPGVSEADRATIIVVRAGSIAQAPDMVFWRTRIRGRIVDSVTGRGRHIESLSIWCNCSDGPVSSFGAGDLCYGPITAQVKDDGTFEFPQVPSGNHFLQVIDSGFVSFAKPITVTETDTAEIEVKVSAEQELRGTIVDRAGRPVSAAAISLKPKASNDAFEIRAIAPAADMTIATRRISFTGPDPVKPSGSDVRRLLTAITKPRVISSGPDGTFTFSGVLPGDYVLEMNVPGGNSAQRDIEVGSKTTSVRMDIPFFQLVGRVVLEGGGALLPIKGSVRIFGTAPGARVFYNIPDSEGRFFALLEPGEYRVAADSLIPDHDLLSISNGAQDLLSQPFIFDGSSPQEIRITVAR